MDAALASTMDAEQVAMCIQLALLCAQGDPQLRPSMRRVVVMLSRRPGHMEEPTRPGVPGSRYRRRSRHTGMLSSTAGTSAASDSHTSDSSGNYTSVTATTATATGTRTRTNSGLAESSSDPKGKRPMKD